MVRRNGAEMEKLNEDHAKKVLEIEAAAEEIMPKSTIPTEIYISAGFVADVSLFLPFPKLPTTQPKVSGIIWNDQGVIKIS